MGIFLDMLIISFKKIIKDTVVISIKFGQMKIFS